MAITDIDEAKLEAFIGLAATELGAALNTALVTLGDELGLYRAMADGQPVSAAEVAARTGTQERYVREWLNTQAASGFVDYDAEAAAFVLPPEHALVLADETSPFSMTGTFQSANAAVAVRERIAGRFVDGDDVGCGHGASTILMADAYPASRFVGVDYHAESIETARRRAAEAGVADRVTF